MYFSVKTKQQLSILTCVFFLQNALSSFFLPRSSQGRFDMANRDLAIVLVASSLLPLFPFFVVFRYWLSIQHLQSTSRASPPRNYLLLTVMTDQLAGNQSKVYAVSCPKSARLGLISPKGLMRTSAIQNGLTALLALSEADNADREHFSSSTDGQDGRVPDIFSRLSWSRKLTYQGGSLSYVAGLFFQ